MSNEQLTGQPYWAADLATASFGPVCRDEQAGVLVVGAGITGLTAAYMLARAGRRVVVLERGTCASADSGHTSAHLTMVTDTRLSELIERFGRTHAQAVWDAGLAAIATIEQISREHGLEAGFQRVDGYLHAALEGSSAPESELLREDEAAARDLGFDVTFQPSVPLCNMPGLRIDAQARFHPRKYLAGLAGLVTASGGQIFERSEVTEFDESARRASVNNHSVGFDHLVIATHNPLTGLAGTAAAALFQTKLALYTSYVIGARVPKGTVPDALWWDTDDPYRYLRLAPRADDDIIIFGGHDHKTGQEPDTSGRYDRLADDLQRIVPDAQVDYRWSGQVLETPDGLPYIGLTGEAQYSATGYAGNGLTFGTVAGMMIADAILGRRNPWVDLFAPSRKALTHGLWDYVKENADYPYYLIRDRFAGSQARSARAVPRGEGAIIEVDGRKVAAYRDDQGELVQRSAICPHLGCVVAWNPAETTWDCPCHGSRFTPAGAVIAGPAESPLEPA